MSDSERSDDDKQSKPAQERDQAKSSSSSSKSKSTVALVMQKDLHSDLLSTFNEIKNSGDLSKVALQTFRSAIDAELESANKYNKIILGSTRLSEEQIEQYSKSKLYKNIKDTYWSIVTEIAVRLESKSDKSEGGSSQSSSKSSICSNEADGFRLPTIDLPKFSGNYEEWRNFNNLFTSSIHNRKNLEPVQKMYYLVKSVSGIALLSIKNLQLTNENYQKARDILEERFNHKRKIAQTILTKLLEYKPISTETSKGLRDFISNTNDCIISLKELDIPTDEWGLILLYNLQSKLPHATLVKWEEELGSSREIPDFKVFLEFLEKRFRTLEMIEVPSTQKEKDKPEKKQQSHKALHTKANLNHNTSSKRSTIKQNKPYVQQAKTQTGSTYTNSKTSSYLRKSTTICAICRQQHYTAQCNSFKNNNPQVRRQLAAQYNLCFNCLGSSHTTDVCYSTKTCTYCKQNHHTLLHIHEDIPRNPTDYTTSNGRQVPIAAISQAIANEAMSNQQITNSNSFYASSDSQRIRILGTALIRIVNSTGYAVTVRALLDSGADDNYITNATVQNAGLNKYSAAAAITGLNGVNVGSTEYKSNFKIESLDGSFEYNTSASVVENITSKIPTKYIEPEECGFLNNLHLADPNFNHPGTIQILLGVGFIVRIRKPGLKRFKDLMAEQTLLGWVVMGQCLADSSQLTRAVLLTKSVSNFDLSKQIQKFFEIEECSDNIPPKPDDVLCENKFLESVKIRPDGHLSLELPFKEDVPIIGPTKHIAMRRFLNLEKKLERNPVLKDEYSRTINDYIKEGHLLPITEPSPPGHEFFLPHHAVMKESSTTTKVRVVFDGSCKSSDLTSLNDHLLTGPKLQTDIRDVFFNWRKYQYALTADIAQMYRMFYIDEKHRNYQKVLWRFNTNDPITEYCLSTVTFGTSSAPFQAIRALHFIAERESAQFPLASKALKNEFYVDDFISGAHSIEIAIQKQAELRTVLSKYGLTIRKWSSNSLYALEGIRSDMMETLTELTFDEEEFRKTLGVYWAPKEDYFSFSTTNFYTDNQKFTKRIILSLIARLYDPVGWVGPCTLHAKLIMQRIWEQDINWDDEVCGSIKSDFDEFMNDLPALSKLKIPRWTKISDETSPLILYGFSDASLKAYGAVLYLRNPNITDQNKLILLTSRTRVKPLKHVSLARLELCAAVMLSELIKWAKKLLEPREIEVHAFSDSKIVLSWLKGHPSRWKMYVAGRTSKILESMSSDQWSYVNTKHNPADIASRGLLPSELISNTLWWNGPILEELEKQDSLTELTAEEHETIYTETKTSQPVLHTVSSSNPIISLINKYSSHGKICRVVRNITNFILNILKKILTKKQTNCESYKIIIQNCSLPENLIYKAVQRVHFLSEIKALKTRQPIHKRSKLCSLHPFLDGFGVLRVGGRLRNSSCISYNQKYPIILPSHHQLTTNLINLAHHATLHGMSSITESYLRSKYHIIRCADRIKVLLKGCPQCIRFARESHEQLMGSLPTSRVNPHRPFLHAGVDYAGPFIIKAYPGRCKKFLKCYVALFICFSTKAIHLELVSELTATAFLAAFRRFVHRRGRCEQLYSDRGTNFVKGDKMLTKEIHLAQLSWKMELDVDFEAMGTKWEFNPPASPHFGGLWEAGVKSMKTHLKKTLGNTLLTGEEFNTILIQIEGILNSRPLCRMSKQTNDYTVLTPAHFLIGESIIAPPDRCYESDDKHPADRWQYLQKLRQMFWVSWKKEYLHRLNTRSKWKHEGIEYKVDDLVILTDENSPATLWPMARIIETFPAKDGITRVVKLKTSKGQTFTRPTAKLRLLAFDPQEFNLDDSSSENL